MQLSTAIAIAVAPTFSALFWRYFMRPLTDSIYRRMKDYPRVRRVLFTKL